MVNPGAFHGSRKEFLTEQKAAYSDAVAEGSVTDTLANIYRRYFKRYPVDLDHKQEPTPEHLEKVNDDEPEPEPEVPNESKMLPEEFEEAMKRFQERGELIKKRQKQIRGWLHYQHMKEHEANESHPDNPYRVLLGQLTGHQNPRPRVPVTRNVWRRDNRPAIEKETRRRAEVGSIPVKNLAPVREKIVKEMYDALTPAQKDYWERRAKSEYDKAVLKWEEESKAPPSESPQNRQKCIQDLAAFVQPILDGIITYTGWKVTLLAGGPEPAQKGRLTMLSVHSGTTKGDVKMNFGRSEHHVYNRHICATFGNFLRKCYSPEDCRQQAISEPDEFSQLQDLAMDTADVYGFETSLDPPSASERLPPTNQSPGVGSLERGEPNIATGPGVAPLPSSASTPPHLPASGIIPPASPIRSSVGLAPISPARSQLGTPLPSPARSHFTTPLPSPARSRADSPLPSPLLSRVASPLIFDTPLHHASRPPPPRIEAQSNNANPAITIAKPRVNTPPIPSTNSASRTPPRVERPLTSSITTAVHTASSFALGTSTFIPPGTKVVSSTAAFPTTQDVDIASSDKSAPKLIPRKRSANDPDDSDVEETNGASAVEVQEHNPRPKRARKSTAKTSTTTSTTSSTTKRVTRVTKTSAESSKGSAKSSTTTSSKSSGVEKPKWFVQSLRMFKSEKLGENWDQLVDAWASFEEKEQYKEKGHLSATHRPDAIATWIASRRSSTWRPHDVNVKTYSQDFRMWWANLQPEWRLEDGNVITGFVDGNLEGLRFPGLNGLQSVLAALFFWGVLARRGLARKAWLEALDDCNAVLAVLAA